MQGVNSQQEVVATEELDDPVGLAISGDDPVGLALSSDRNPADQDLLGVSVSSIDEAYEVYNDYAFRLGFSVRRGKQRYSAGTKQLKMKEFNCSKSGFKRVLRNGSYLKVDVRTGCRASVQFDLDGNGMWTVTKHQKLHNHEFVPTTKSYLLRSHRSVSRNHLSYIKDLKKSGVCVADGLRFLKTQSGGHHSLVLQAGMHITRCALMY
ncbi:protein FAR1-RELATED SEQUENCE 5-like [Ipomoea triloba]|uniref:protein FAR1-RELATED SEQUENCE 5-like n=1 Tax=Ipomoea triloba TaxID=35885 RepID=UPI00125D81B9|nr:protein FAR1-RELATED SEQUENCE 5-like [Ipomoea triloba]